MFDDDFEPTADELRAARLQWSKLSCQGKADADAFFHHDLSDVATGPECGLKHLGCCNPSGESFFVESEASK
jgi:hypothetical protein